MTSRIRCRFAVDIPTKWHEQPKSTSITGLNSSASFFNLIPVRDTMNETIPYNFIPNLIWAPISYSPNLEETKLVLRLLPVLADVTNPMSSSTQGRNRFRLEKSWPTRFTLEKMAAIDKLGEGVQQFYRPKESHPD